MNFDPDSENITQIHAVKRGDVFITETGNVITADENAVDVGRGQVYFAAHTRVSSVDIRCAKTVNVQLIG